MAIDLSMKNHVEVITESAKSLDEALELTQLLIEHVEYRLKHYTKCISKSTPNYLKYLLETYLRQLKQVLYFHFQDEQ
jgi:hypothetical protein